MWSTRGIPLALAIGGVVVAAGVAMAGAGPVAQAPAAQAPAARIEVRDTRKNLQAVFENEMNANARYVEAAKIADREGYPYVASLFRACARAEQAHADQHVHAIAWTSDVATAHLEKKALGTTAENLRAAIDRETDEATRLYPALLERARAEHMSPAVRSMNFALAAEREHARLFAAALETLDQRPGPRAFHVCPQCGKTVESVAFEKCPNCFGSARKFVRVP